MTYLTLLLLLTSSFFDKKIKKEEDVDQPNLTLTLNLNKMGTYELNNKQFKVNGIN